MMLYLDRRTNLWGDLPSAIGEGQSNRVMIQNDVYQIAFFYKTSSCSSLPIRSTRFDFAAHDLQPASMSMPIDHDQQLLLYWRWQEAHRKDHGERAGFAHPLPEMTRKRSQERRRPRRERFGINADVAVSLAAPR